MRLKHLKLAGFKSFVDPTKIEFTQALSAVVGPNGCGKSNIIDAVRWVLGESSAKNLRGDGMTDVIFNGSGGRKPVSNASVELLFDNSDGSAGGAWASFSDIAIKRQVNRDGQSDYFVNGQKCRRRDISDLLSGTGLGPRSYSIIEQGTISRLVESKPQELRVFIEEAAGISKYKERKRDTENRIRHSRENLSRLADLRHELQGQIDSLETQAQLAQDYTGLKKQERELNQNIIVARWQMFIDEFSQVDESLNTLQAQMAQVAHDVEELQSQEKERAGALTQSRNELDLINTQCHSIETDIARLQLSIEHLNQNALQNDNKHNELSLKLDALSQQKQAQIEQLAHAKQTLNISSEALPKFLETQKATELAASKHEQEAEQREHNFSELSQERQRLEGQLLVAKQGQSQRAQEHIKLTSQIDMLAKKQMELVTTQQQLKPKALEQQVTKLQQQALIAKQTQENAEQLISNVRGQIAQNSQRISEHKEQLAQLENRRDTIELLIKQQVSADVEDLQAHYGQQAQVWQLIQVEPKWQRAASLVLTPFLSAFMANNLPNDDNWPQHRLLINAHENSKKISTSTTRLSHYISSNNLAIQALIERVCGPIHIATNYQQAKAILPTIATNESVVSENGCWLSHHVCQLGDVNTDELRHGVLALKEQLLQIKPDIDQQILLLEQVQSQAQELAGKLNESLAQKTQADSMVESADNQALATKQRWLLEQQQWQHLATNIEDILSQHEHTLQLLAIENKQRDQYHHEIAVLEQQLNSTQAQLKVVQGTRSLDKQQSKLLQKKQNSAQQQVHQQQLQIQKHQLKHDNCESQLAQLVTQLDELARDITALERQKITNLTPLEEKKSQLKTLNQQLFEQQDKQQIAQQQVTDITAKSSEFNALWQQNNTLKDQLQRQLEKLRVKKETLKVKIAAQEQSLELNQRDMALISQQLDEQGQAKIWAVKLNDIRDKLAKMGAINLTAIEQYNEQKSRLDYLTKQNDDLEQGLKTLESAIRKIDRESREKFKSTFDSVNNDFKQLFPKVFGGGSAQLTLTDSDLLIAGVSIMAQPPGKKNSTIALLSGGEKALTALSLVFAIFQLNPAPFCMLDEVDAPLDDANVDRYCNLVKEMSEKVQFIYITHNKVSMEMATQLTGVTMQEAGISRVVAVDVDAAVSLAQQ